MSKIKQSTEIATNRYKAKPIFAEEKKFIESRLPQIAPLPDACWIYGGNTKTVWVDLYSSQYLLKFKVENGGEFSVLKDGYDKLPDDALAAIKKVVDELN